MARYENGIYYNDDGSIFDPSSLFGGGGGFAPAPVQQQPQPQRSAQAMPNKDQNLIDTIRQYSQGASQKGQSNYLNSLLGQGYSQDYLTGIIRQATGDQGFTADDFNYLRNYQAPAPTQVPMQSVMQPTQAPVMAAPAPMPVAMTPAIAPTMAPTAAPYDIENFNRYRQQAGLLSQGQGLLGASYDDPFATNDARAQGQSLLDQANSLQVDRGRVQSDLLRAIQSGEDLNQYYGDTYGDSLQLLQDLGVNRGGKDAQRILDANPTGESGAWKFDPVYGSDYYKQYVSQVGQQLGLSQEQINKAAGQFATETLYNPQGKGFDGGIGDPKFLTDLTRRVINASGQNSFDPKFTGLLQGTGQFAGQLANSLYSEGNESGTVKNIARKIGESPEALALIAAATGGLGSLAGLGSVTSGAIAGGAVGAIPGIGQGSFKETLTGGLKGGLIGGATAGLAQGASNLYNGNPLTQGFFGGTGGTPSVGGIDDSGFDLGQTLNRQDILQGIPTFNGPSGSPESFLDTSNVTGGFAENPVLPGFSDGSTALDAILGGLPSTGGTPNSPSTPSATDAAKTAAGGATGIKGLLDGFSTGNAIVDKLLGGLLGGAILSQISGAGGGQQQGTPYTPITPQQYTINPVVQRYTGDPAKYGESDIGNFRFYNSGLLG